MHGHWNALDAQGREFLSLFAIRTKGACSGAQKPSSQAQLYPIPLR
jgi:hypothetical protein